MKRAFVVTLPVADDTDSPSKEEVKELEEAFAAAIKLTVSELAGEIGSAYFDIEKIRCKYSEK